MPCERIAPILYRQTLGSELKQLFREPRCVESRASFRPRNRFLAARRHQAMQTQQLFCAEKYPLFLERP